MKYKEVHLDDNTTSTKEVIVWTLNVTFSHKFRKTIEVNSLGKNFSFTLLKN